MTTKSTKAAMIQEIKKIMPVCSQRVANVAL